MQHRLDTDVGYLGLGSGALLVHVAEHWSLCVFFPWGHWGGGGFE